MASAAPTTLDDPSNKKDEESAANAHGAPAKPSPAASVVAAAPISGDDKQKDGEQEKKGALARAQKPTDDRDTTAYGGMTTPPAGAPNTLPMQQGQSQTLNAPPPAPTATATPGYGSGGGGAAFNNAMAAYNAGRYDDAARLFGALAANDSSAALWEARSMREGSPKCRGAVTKFDLVAQRAAGTTVGYDAKLEGARCYRVIGQVAAAQQRLNELLSVPSHADRAKDELQKISNTNAAKAPAKAPAAPPAAPNTKSDQSYRY